MGHQIDVTGEYPQLWKRGLIQPLVRARANHRCEECGMEFKQGTNLALTEKRRNGHAMIGTVHHIDGNKSNCSMRNLVFLCQRCHYRMHLNGWTPGKRLPKQWQEKAPTWVEVRGLIYQFNLQMFQEVQS